MFIALGKQEADAEDLSNIASQEGRFDKIVALLHQHLANGFRTGDKDAVSIEDEAVVDQSVVWDFVDPSCHRGGSGFAEDGCSMTVIPGCAL